MYLSIDQISDSFRFQNNHLQNLKNASVYLQAAHFLINMHCKYAPTMIDITQIKTKVAS